jgi:hypothetical protein
MVTILRDSDHENNLMGPFCDHGIELIGEKGCKQLNRFSENAQIAHCLAA